MYPRLVVDLKKLRSNLDACAKIVKEDGGCSLMIVTKGLCADPEMARMVADHPAVEFMADSRVANIKTYAAEARAKGKKTVLLRLPMACETAEVVKYVDLSFNSELATIRLLNEEAGKIGVKHNILLMIDMGDLREGIFYQNEDLIMPIPSGDREMTSTFTASASTSPATVRSFRSRIIWADWQPSHAKSRRSSISS